MVGRLRNVSGEVVATEASFERKGSFMFIGGNLPLFWALTAQEALKFLLLRDCEEVETDERKMGIGKCRVVAMASELWLLFLSVFPRGEVREACILFREAATGWWRRLGSSGACGSGQV